MIMRMAFAHKEAIFDVEPMVLKLRLCMISDTNEKIRMDGARFLQDYLPEAKESQRFDSVYFPELIELLNDEENYVRIEAIKAALEVIDRMSTEDIEKEFIPVVFKIVDSQTVIEEILLRLS